MQKLEPNLRMKTLKSVGAFRIGERNKRGELLVKSAEEHRLEHNVQETQKQVLDMGVNRWENTKTDRFCAGQSKKNSEKL